MSQGVGKSLIQHWRFKVSWVWKKQCILHDFIHFQGANWKHIKWFFANGICTLTQALLTSSSTAHMHEQMNSFKRHPGNGNTICLFVLLLVVCWNKNCSFTFNQWFEIIQLKTVLKMDVSTLVGCSHRTIGSYISSWKIKILQINPGQWASSVHHQLLMGS